MCSEGDDTATALAAHVRQLEDTNGIRALVARYGFVIDNRDLAGIGECFASDGVLQSADGVMNAVGRNAVLELYRGRFAVLGPTFHFTHDQVIDFEPSNPNAANGLVAAHAEVVRFFYYTPVEQYAATMRSVLRQRAYGDERPADRPEALESWRAYHRGASNS